MVQKLFSIYTQPEESHRLHVEIGKAHLACWCDDGKTGFTALEYFTFDYDGSEGSFVDVFRELKRCSILLRNEFASEEIVWENADFMCVPNDVFKEEKAAVYLGFVNSQSFQSPPMHRRLNDCTLTFTADSIFYKIVKENLPNATHTHKLHQLLLQQNEEIKNRLQMQFYQSHFLLTATKNGALQLATVYSFATPHEAVYHILNTLDKLDMTTEETNVYLSGFIDEKSALYKEIYSYVSNLRFAQTGRIKDEYPAHYFTTYNLPVT